MHAIILAVACFLLPGALLLGLWCALTLAARTDAEAEALSAQLAGARAGRVP